MRRIGYIESVFRDLRYAGRTLAGARSFTLTVLATLALGIGANTSIFQLLDAVRLRTLPVQEPHRLAQIEIPKLNFGILEGEDNLSYPLYEEVRAHQEAFSGIFAWESSYETARIGQGAEGRRVSAVRVTGEFFSTLGVAPASGRLFRAEDDLRGCPAPGVVLSYAFW